ncbi:response regulator [Paenibacillus sepulcri]
MNIFLVEDERWALEELKTLFQSYEEEHRIFAFGNGEDALAAAARAQPHLVLTDINMPGMDGLELISELSKADPAVKGIILSVHDEFEYARQGVKIGVVDYLLKPVKKDALYLSIDKAINGIRNEQRQREERMNWSISRMLFASCPAEEEMAAPFYGHGYLMALLLLGNWGAHRGWQDTGIHNSELRSQIVYGTVREEDIHCLDLDSRRKIILVPVAADSGKCGMESRLIALFQRMDESVQLSYVFKNANERLSKCFALLNRRLEENMRLGMPTCISPDARTMDADISGIWDKVRMMETLFSQGDLRRGTEMIHKITAELKRKKITMRQLQGFIRDLLYSLQFKWRLSQQGRVDQPKMQDELLSSLNELSSYEELNGWLSAKIMNLHPGRESKAMKPKSMIPLLMQWIHSHYQHNICLQQFAADHHVSLGYLSKLFKNQTGCTFSDYLIHYRIGKAKILLTEGMERLSDVSGLVGYEDAKHFSHVFKKIVGESPQAYAKRTK